MKLIEASAPEFNPDNIEIRRGGIAPVNPVNTDFQEDERRMLEEAMDTSKFNYHAVSRGQGVTTTIPASAPERWALISKQLETITTSIAGLHIEKMGMVNAAKNQPALTMVAQAYRTILAVVDSAQQLPDNNPAHTIYQRATGQFNNPTALRDGFGKPTRSHASQLMPDGENLFLRVAQSVRQLDIDSTPVIFMDEPARDRMVDQINTLWAGKTAERGVVKAGLGHAVYEEAVHFEQMWVKYEKAMTRYPAVVNTPARTEVSPEQDNSMDLGI